MTGVYFFLLFIYFLVFSNGGDNKQMAGSQGCVNVKEIEDANAQIIKKKGDK